MSRKCVSTSCLLAELLRSCRTHVSPYLCGLNYLSLSQTAAKRARASGTRISAGAHKTGKAGFDRSPRHYLVEPMD